MSDVDWKTILLFAKIGDKKNPAVNLPDIERSTSLRK